MPQVYLRFTTALVLDRLSNQSTSHLDQLLVVILSVSHTQDYLLNDDKCQG